MTRERSEPTSPESKVTGNWVADLQKEVDELKNLIAWIAPLIKERNGLGGISDKFCTLCVRMKGKREMVNGRPQLVRAPCRHDEIFVKADDVANSNT